MTWQEGSDSEQESDEGTGASQKSQKRAGGKFQNHTTKGSDEPFPDLLQFQSAASNYGCLSLLKKRRSGRKDCVTNLSLSLSLSLMLETANVFLV